MSNSISENIARFSAGLPEDVTLVAVSKTKPNSAIMEAYDAGQRVFGENKIQEMCQKHEELPKDIQWHMIGHVQRNKVKYMAPFVAMIHGIDTLKLLQEVNKRALQQQRVIPCLLQVHIATESSKFGFSAEEIRNIFKEDSLNTLEGVSIRGLMGMASNTPDEEQVKKEFSGLHALYEEMKTLHPGMDTLSMGMSGDYEMAIACGSNMVRVGSSIFGARNYKI